ncbi:erythromycin biosynthesis sensory transduction protein eryC1 [Paramagnetospirillum marisnigri]|uniref:Erythromycin biosynthesis sensory transduction protein eryC1 n=1 Tax=Paramagnetospirillum marisnigri TaxID=1285242 RepID=A0A178MVV5_9PROT|nr:DegT/DnrJ/EryC1/StrS family aminotransferase [Paramagnetospirillum marisnigri]OAN54677.1 erythromycin biosynthesis sensory transduction protein eryC1 [Paramagnetospirillum marisnigri]
MILCSFPPAQNRPRRAAILDALARVVDADICILGAEVAAFEAEMAAHNGSAHCIGVNSGTDALVLALQALGVRPGDEVITVSHTALATVAAVTLTGAVPVLVEVDPLTRTICPKSAEAAVTAKTKAMVAVHLYGQPCAMDALLDLAKRKGIALVEDCAQAQGATYAGRRVGSMGDAGCFSFYPTKNLGAIGDGGAVTTNDSGVAERVRQLRQYGWDESRVSQRVGHNSRLDEMQAAILRLKLPDLDADNARRAAVSARYNAALAGLPGLTLPPVVAGTEAAHHLYVIETERRDALKAHLADRGVLAGIHYALPAHRNPGYATLVRLPPGGLPVTEALVGRILTLPIYPELSEAEIKVVVDGVRSFFGGTAA